MATTLGRDDRCPCGSGKKVKKCCGVQPVPRGYTVHDREALFGELDLMIDEQLAEEEEAAYEIFWGCFYDREDELGTDLLNASNDVQFTWFVCDYMLDEGVTPLERLLTEHPHLTLGARAFADQLRASSVGLYQVIGVVPGVSLTLRNEIEGGEPVTVAERTASMTVNQFDWLAARVIAKGPSGKPEMERGVLPIPRMLHEDVHAELKSMRESALHSGNLALFRQEVPPFLHRVWVSAILAPRLPALQNTDGEPLLITREHFQVMDPALLARTLDTHEALSYEDNRWHWSGTNAQGTTVTLGTLELTERSLVLEANSQARAERGRTLVSQLARETVRHRATTHEDLEL